MEDNSQILDLIILICDKIIKMKNVYNERTDCLTEWLTTPNDTRVSACSELMIMK